MPTVTHPPAPALTLICVVPPQVLLLDLAGPIEAFRIANRLGAQQYTFRFVGLTDTVETSIGLSFTGVSPLPETLPPQAWLVILGQANAGISSQSAAMQPLIAWLTRVGSHAALIATVCSGALVAAQAGLLAGRQATTHYSLLEDLARIEPTARIAGDRIFTTDGRLHTSAGICAGIDLALHLIANTGGPLVAAAVAREMVVYLRRAGQDPQLSPWLAHRNHLHPTVHRAQQLIAAAPTEDWALGRIADAVQVSARHLNRLFQEHAGTTVAAYHALLRAEHLRQLFAQSPNEPLERLARRAGYGSVRTLRRAWHTYFADQPLPNRP